MAKLSQSNTKGGLRSPMSGFEAQPNHRMPSTEGTTEMMPSISKKQAANVQSPQTPFKINPNAGRKK